MKPDKSVANPIYIYILPLKLNLNSYLSDLQELLGFDTSYELPIISSIPALIIQIINDRFQQKDVIIILNWHENYTISRSKAEFSWVRSLYGFFLILIYRFFSSKLIYVKHNHYPHRASKSSVQACRFFIGLYQRISSITVIHSPLPSIKSLQQAYIPHRLYQITSSSSAHHLLFSSIDEYDCIDIAFEFVKLNSLNIRQLTKANYLKPNRYFVVFGRIEPYKNIDKLVNIWTLDEPLIIIGPSSDEQYLKEIKRLSSNKNIILLPRFAPTSILNTLISNSISAIIPNSADSIVMSGAFIYLVSLRKKFFCLSSLPFMREAQYHQLKYVRFANTYKELLSLCKIEISNNLISSYSVPSTYDDLKIKDAWDSVFIF